MHPKWLYQTHMRMYEGREVICRTMWGEMSEISIWVGLYQGSNFQTEVHWCMLFIDNLDHIFSIKH